MYLYCQGFLIGPTAENLDLQAHMLLRSYYTQTSVRLVPPYWPCRELSVTSIKHVHYIQSLTTWSLSTTNRGYCLLSKLKRFSFESILPKGISPALKEPFLKERFLCDNSPFCALWKHLQSRRTHVLSYHMKNLRWCDFKIEFSWHSVVTFSFAWICTHRLE